MRTSDVHSLLHLLFQKPRKVEFLHWVELIASILVLKLVLDHMEHVATCYVGCGILLTYNCILAAAKVVALQTMPHSSCLFAGKTLSLALSRA